MVRVREKRKRRRKTEGNRFEFLLYFRTLLWIFLFFEIKADFRNFYNIFLLILFNTIPRRKFIVISFLYFQFSYKRIFIKGKRKCIIEIKLEEVISVVRAGSQKL